MGSRGYLHNQTNTDLAHIPDLIIPLKDIPATLLFLLPALPALPHFAPGCDTDAIVVALTDFVAVQSALLEILIVRAGLLGGERDTILERNDLIGALIAGALRALEVVFDTLAYDLISLLPTRQTCLRLQWKGLDVILREAIAAYEGRERTG